MRGLTLRDLATPAALLALSAVPMIGGAARMVSLSGPVTAESARFHGSPAPIVAHVVGATLYAVLGSAQFSRGLRARWPAWHRRVGRVAAAAGLLCGLSGLWMTSRYAIPVGMQGSLLYVARWVVGVAMVASLVAGVVAVLRGRIPQHEAWMTRAYALAMGAGTQALVLGPWTILTGESTGLTRDLLMTASWAINALLAERWIQRAENAQRGGARRIDVAAASSGSWARLASWAKSTRTGASAS